MKLLFITSLYSGLRESILNNKWKPNGMPAIYKLQEGLRTRNFNFDSVYFSENVRTGLYKNHFLNNNNYIYSTSVVSMLKIPKILVDCINFLRIWKLRNKYDIFYVDRSNVLIGALLTFLNKKVILRLHGVADLYERYENTFNKFKYFISILSFRAKFDAIICTKDGSPVDLFTEKYCHPDSKLYSWFNGVSFDKDARKITRRDYNISNDTLVLGFISRISWDKGIWDFVKTLKRLNEMNFKIKFLIVGDGPYLSDIVNHIKKEKVDNVIITGKVNHSIIPSYLKICDVYISLNYLGNLSNSTLEAVHSSKCIITLKDKPTLKNSGGYEILNDAAIFIDRDDVIQELEKKIVELYYNREIIEYYSTRINSKSKLLSNWEDRIGKEIDLIDRIMNNGIKIEK